MKECATADTIIDAYEHNFVQYALQVRGICGNYNGDDTDELLTADGEEAESFAEVANSYQVAECDDPTTPPFVCPARATSIW